MKKNSLLILIAILLTGGLALRADAGTIDLIGWYGWTDLSGDARIASTDIGDLDDIDIDFDSETGFGVGVNLFLGNRLSFQAAVYRFENEAAATAGNGLSQFTLGQLEVIPVTGVIQLHLLPNSAIDPYAGIGLGYVLLDNIETTDDLEGIDLDRVELEDDYGVVYNVGVNIDLASALALNIDVKYVPVESSATAVFLTGPGQQTSIEVNPLIVSAGIALRF